MALFAQASDDGTNYTIRITNRFDFSIHREFRDAYRDKNTPGLSYRVDLSCAEYMDSSALGMLLLLKEHVESHKGRITLAKPSPAVNQILTLANFQQLFIIEN